MTYTVAAVAVATGIAPQFLMADAMMLRAIVQVLQDNAKAQQKAARR